MPKVLLPLLLLLLTAEPPSTAALLDVSSSAPPPTDRPNNSFGVTDPTFAVVVVALIMAFFLTGILTIGIRHCRQNNVIVYSTNTTVAGGSLPHPHGLDPSVIKSFPIFNYSGIIGGKGEGLLECAVCICDFVEGDKLRLLPMCNHVFHPHCIDNWLVSRSTCPICRINQSNQCSKTDGYAGRCNVRTGENPGGEIRVLANQFSVVVDSCDHPSDTDRNPARSVEKFPVSNSTADEVRIQVDTPSPCDESGV